MTSYLARTRGHPFAQTEWPHVSPSLFDVLQAICSGTALTDRSPPVGNALILAPDGILFLVIGDDEINRVIRLVGHSTILPYNRLQMKRGRIVPRLPKRQAQRERRSPLPPSKPFGPRVVPILFFYLASLLSGIAPAAARRARAVISYLNASTL